MARVTIKLQPGTDITSVDSATVSLTSLSTDGGNPATITPYVSGSNTYEALAAPQTVAAGEPFIQVDLNGGGSYYFRPKNDVVLKAGNRYIYTVNVNAHGLDVQVSESIDWNATNPGNGDMDAGILDDPTGIGDATKVGGSGIGGYVISSNNGATCGNITISDVTIISYGSGDSMSSDMAAGIGSAVGASCGNIAIENATVHAYGVLFDPIATPAIGCGYPSSGIPKSIPVVKISNDSDIHAHRGGSVGNTDYIGWAGSSWGMNANSTINLGGGTCTSSTVYCYTGDGNIVDKIVVYDANGNATQK